MYNSGTLWKRVAMGEPVNVNTWGEEDQEVQAQARRRRPFTAPPISASREACNDDDGAVVIDDTSDATVLYARLVTLKRRYDALERHSRRLEKLLDAFLKQQSQFNDLC